MDLTVPELVRRRALANGAAGQAWLDSLPDVVGELATRWGLHLGRPYTGGTASFVTDATDGGGRACVLKVAMPLDMDELDTFHRSVLVHQLAEGRGCAQLIEHDLDVAAMLLERLGPDLGSFGLDVDDVIAAVVDTLQTFWRPAPADAPLQTGAAKAAWLASYTVATWESSGRPCSREVIDRAVHYCEERAAAYDPQGAVVVHGDAHGWNTLRAADGTYKFVDPEGLRSDRAHDLSVVMREYNEPLLAGDTARLTRERADRLAQRCGIDPEPVWQWGYVERVATGLANLRDFGADAGAPFLEVAQCCLA